MKNNKGFTLIEVISVFAIMSILAALAYPRLNGTMKDYKFKQEISILRSDILNTRNKAITEGVNYRIIFNTEENYYLINKSVMTINKESFDQTDISWTSFNNGILVYTPSGAPQKAGTIRVKNYRGEQYNITIIIATGKIRIYKV